MTEIVEQAVQDLVPYARNPRKKDAVVDQMAASIREFGFKVTILALSSTDTYGSRSLRNSESRLFR